MTTVTSKAVASIAGRMSRKIQRAMKDNKFTGESTVYFSSLTDGARDALEQRRPALQALVGRSARMKRTPKLHFEVDPGVTEGAKIDEALRRLADSAGEG